MTSNLHPFQATAHQLACDADRYIDQFVDSLQSFFMIMPRGPSFVSQSRFQVAYNRLFTDTNGFRDLCPESALKAVRADPLVLVVLRSILGFSPPELAHMANITVGVGVDQSTARRLDKRAREGVDLFSRTRADTQAKVQALVNTAVHLILSRPPELGDEVLHRLSKADTADGIEGVRALAGSGVSYVTLLYERFLGRAFATHRDTVSGQVGDIVEEAVTHVLIDAQIPYYKAGVAERFEDMDQAPDFLIPDQLTPSVVVEAKLAEDDGTVRDKVTRIQHLAELRDRLLRRGAPAFEVVACVDGRGFGIRREDVRKLLNATEGKLFTLATVGQLVENTSMRVLGTQS